MPVSLSARAMTGWQPRLRSVTSSRTVVDQSRESIETPGLLLLTSAHQNSKPHLAAMLQRTSAQHRVPAGGSGLYQAFCSAAQPSMLPRCTQHGNARGFRAQGNATVIAEFSVGQLYVPHVHPMAAAIVLITSGSRSSIYSGLPARLGRQLRASHKSAVTLAEQLIFKEPLIRKNHFKNKKPASVGGCLLLPEGWRCLW